jgi:hypothetical protein
MSRAALHSFAAVAWQSTTLLLDTSPDVVCCRGGDTAADGLLSTASVSFEPCNLRAYVGGHRHAMLLSSA